MASPLAVAVVGIVVAMSAASVAAQTPIQPSITGSAIYSTQAPGKDPGADPGVPKPAIGGSAPGFSVEAEFPIYRGLGVGGEFSNVGTFDGIQTTSGTFSSISDNHHRDRIVSALVHFHLRPVTRLDVDLAGGYSYVREETTGRLAQAPPGTTSYGSYGPETTSSENTFGGVGGISLAIRLAPHISVGPTARVYFIKREFKSQLLGLSATVLRLGGSVRVSF